MSDRSSVALRIMGSRATLLGAQDSLQSINTTELDDGAFCYVTTEHVHYELHRDSTAASNPPVVIQPSVGPGRWTVATGGQGFQGSQGAQGATGVQGAQGTQGAGFQGAQGATGVQGSQGSQGTQGAGLQGAQGFQGATGVQGSQGSQGTQGAGLQGAQGATGVQGSQGSQGTQGAGAQGSQGAQGATGVQGSQGSQGAGLQGAQGATGVQGSQGSQGTQGAGAQGSQGAQGATGVQGSQGSQGAGLQGAQGTTGVQGSQGFQGTTGAGAQGSQGFQGATGAQGSQGFQGTAGTGAQGAQGATGAQGSQGATGAQGAQGNQGAQGATGAQGSQGFQGATGSGSQGAQGFQGARGFQGFQGLQGTTGAQGSQGNQGATGAQGLQGLQGLQGTTGTTGAQGLQGFQGATGAQGTTGAQGSQGAQGATGATGAQGSQGFQGASGALFNPLNQVYYVDATNAGAQTGSIAQPYVSPTAAFAARTTNNITLLIAPGTYATALAIGGARNITMVGLGEPGDQAVILGAITTTFTTTSGQTLTLQNLSCTTITDSSAIAATISMIDSKATGTITGSGVASTNTTIRLSSTVGGPRANGMRVEAITSFYQIVAEEAYINGVVSSANVLTTEAAQNTFRACTLVVQPTIGAMTAYDTLFSAGISTASGATKNFFYNCQFDGSVLQGGGGSGDTVVLFDCRIGAASLTSTETLGAFAKLELHNVRFGPKSTGHIQVSGSLAPGMYMDSASEKSFWLDGLGRIVIGSSLGVWTTLDTGEESGQTIGDANLSTDASIASRYVLARNLLTASRTITIGTSSAVALQRYYVDNYGTGAGFTLTVLVGATSLYVFNNSAPTPQRAEFQLTEDALTIVYVGLENL